ncbi:capsule biosynthesis protein CapK [Methanospirillum stamsii]|uniref:Capsule biosynthesis protein CapK n=1 Tax=Methanospirillum stamsii TaxID=1277351 RepID=A0A2V2MUB9_9EURY|nr:capsule biosynthesis protein CapK [Methanospirillum stamsii]
MGNIEDQFRKILLNRIKIRNSREYLEILGLSNPDLLSSFIMQKRDELYLHAYYHTRYYNQVFQKIGLIKNGKVDHEKIPEIPILTKDIIRNNNQNLISDDSHKRKFFYNSSGGSTGEPIRLIQDDYYLKWRNATNNFYYQNILNVDEPMVKKVILWGSERDLFKGGIDFKTRLQNKLTNSVFLNSFKMTEEDISKNIQKINSFKPEILRGYAGSLFELCNYAEQKKISLYSPKIIVSAAENLSDRMRATIESNFGTKVFNFYGSREVSNLSGECEKGLLHSFQFWNYIEVLDNYNQKVKEGEEGKIIVTNLFNYSMPLIRFEIGDMAILGPETCSCGSVLPTLKKVTGRITDHFTLENGAIIHGEYFSHLFYLKDWVKSFQVIQEDYSLIRIKIVIKDKINLIDQADIEEKIKLVMGSNSIITWEIVKTIPKTQSGKYRYTKSLITR